jgi:hypothetical protein
MSALTGRKRHAGAAPGRTRMSRGPRGGRLGRVAGAVGGLLPGGRARGFRFHRRRGITATELRGFRKVTGLLRRVGMVPKGLRRAPRRTV